jgi:hypothetical protein
MNENFERFFLDEWWYTPVLVLAMLWAFGIGWAVGTVWTLLL